MVVMIVLLIHTDYRDSEYMEVLGCASAETLLVLLAVKEPKVREIASSRFVASGKDQTDKCAYAVHEDGIIAIAPDIDSLNETVQESHRALGLAIERERQKENPSAN